MMTNNQNMLSDKKMSNFSMVSTSLNGQNIRQRNSIRNNDISSNTTKKEWAYGNQNNKEKEKYEINLRNESNTLNEIYYNKEIELNEVMNELQFTKDNYKKKYNNLQSKKEKYESLRQQNLNLKLMIMNIIKIKNKNKDK